MDRSTANRPLLIIIGIAVALRLIGVWLASDLEPKRDERQYLAAAKTISETGYPVYPNPHWDEAHAAPGYPYLLAACYELVGKESFRLASRVVQVALSVLTVVLVWWIARRYASRLPAKRASNYRRSTETSACGCHRPR